jgi:hypothetical protein
LLPELAQRGAVSVSRLVEHDDNIEWPTLQQRVNVYNGEAVAVGFLELPDTLALTCWLHRDALIARLDRENRRRRRRQECAVARAAPAARGASACRFA